MVIDESRDGVRFTFLSYLSTDLESIGRRKENKKYDSYSIKQSYDLFIYDFSMQILKLIRKKDSIYTRTRTHTHIYTYD